jgi:GNAT superfamily N-acetyltransferase
VNVELVDPATITDADIAAMQVCAATCWHELHPAEPVPPVAHVAQLARNPGTVRPMRWFLAWDDARSRVLGAAETHWLEGAESFRVHMYIEVSPDARRRGVGRALLDAVREHAQGEGRTALLGSAAYAGAGVDFARAVGAKFGLDEIRSVYWLHEETLPLSAVPGISIVKWRSACPEEYVQSFADVRGVMNTAPQGGDVEYPDDRWDTDRVRQIEQNLREQQLDLYEVAARDDETGELVGYTEVVLYPNWPGFGEQWDTGVLPEYRERGVAKWVKTSMLQWLRNERTELKLLTTWNAAVNDAMLAVNKGLGYGSRERWIEAEVAV